MTEQELQAYVEKADADTVRVRVMDASLDAALVALGFGATIEPGVYALDVADDVRKAQLFDALRTLGVAFADGKEWCPAEVFEYLRDMNLLSGTFTRVSWREPGRYHLVEV
ncbi:hypothetical protein [Pseudomonas protegens]|uniref:hypothetical protein n=1 Tax=Pseudomonas protegens TaxID=380021 RepID=UPI0022832443|nr:hypothetical protein [Pseudomonas protegens]